MPLLFEIMLRTPLYLLQDKYFYSLNGEYISESKFYFKLFFKKIVFISLSQGRTLNVYPSCWGRVPYT